MNKQEFLAMSLPYGLKVLRKADNAMIMYESVHYMREFDKKETRATYIPILRNLSDLTKPIEHNGEKFVPVKQFSKEDRKDIEIAIAESAFMEILPFYTIQYLIEWHFDIANLIEKGEAIDVNTLSVNPYK